jgi:putative ATP-dependent endonuclease of the OLD family
MKLCALEISNFKGITEKVKILIDTIVILIGPNNCCKSTILDAYEAYCSSGATLPKDSFHNGTNIVPIEITGVFNDITDDDVNILGKEWFLESDQEFGACAKFKFRWEEPDKKGEKYSYSNKNNEWKKGGAGGWDSLLSNRLPKPIRINPFDTTEKLESILKDLISKSVTEAIKNDKSKIVSIIEKIRELGKEIEKTIEHDINDINKLLKENMIDSFPGLDVYFDTDVGKFEPDKAIKEGSRFIFTTNNMSAPLQNQGSGVQRAFLWSAIKAYSEKGLLKEGRAVIDASAPKVLLIDEPENNLHPSIIKTTRKALYSLSSVPGWQIICTTHNPIFIDLSKNHTTIIKVSNNQKELKYFQTDKASFSEDEKTNLKMINLCNPMVNEFFFYDKILLVEGETEETALKILLNKYNKSNNYSVINCRGKANIPTFVKIISKFKAMGIAFHDSDTEKLSSGNINPMWTINKKILQECNESDGYVYPIVHIKDFEDYYLSEKISKDKPYNIYQHIMSFNFDHDKKYEKLRELVNWIEKGTHPNKYSTDVDFDKLCKNQ